MSDTTEYIICYRDIRDIRYRPFTAKRFITGMDDVIRFVSTLRDFEVYAPIDKRKLQERVEALRKAESQDSKHN